jgi:hypothetical protein
MENIEFRGISGNSIPLGISDMKLLQGGYRRGDETTYEYTIVGVLIKNSTDPSESFFEVSIALVDEFGRYIGNEQSITLPSTSGREVITLFTAHSTQHLELKIHPHSEVQPVAVEFTTITEISKAEFIQTNLFQAVSYLRNLNFDAARRAVELILRIDAANDEALELLERINETEQEYLETQQEPDPTPTPEPSPEPTPTPEPTPSPTPTPEPSPSPTPELTPPPDQDDIILTVDNCDILKALFNTGPEASRMLELAESLRGQTIAFDGFIFERYIYSQWNPITGRTTEHPGYSTVHLREGNSEDGDDALINGPFMRMDDVWDNEFPVILTAGSMVRDSGGNVRVIAEVSRVENPERLSIAYIILKPISIEARR